MVRAPLRGDQRARRVLGHVESGLAEAAAIPPSERFRGGGLGFVGGEAVGGAVLDVGQQTLRTCGSGDPQTLRTCGSGDPCRIDF
jgi:hypothetical protein